MAIFSWLKFSSESIRFHFSIEPGYASYPAMAEELGLAGQNITGEVNDKTVAFVTWTVVSFFVLLNVVVISFQIYGQRSEFFLIVLFFEIAFLKFTRITMYQKKLSI